MTTRLLAAIAALTVFLPAASWAQSPRTDSPATCFEKAYNAKSAEAIAGCFADTVRVYSVLGAVTTPMVWSQADVVRVYRGIFTRMPRARQITLQSMREGSFIATRERLEEIQPGVNASGITVYQIVGGKIAALWSYSDP